MKNLAIVLALLSPHSHIPVILPVMLSLYRGDQLKKLLFYGSGKVGGGGKGKGGGMFLLIIINEFHSLEEFK